MRYLLPRRVPSKRLHRASGREVVVVGRKTHYLGLAGAPEAEDRYRGVLADWVREGLAEGYAPGEWRPRDFGYEGVLTVAELVGGYEVELARRWGEGWKDAAFDPVKHKAWARKYRRLVARDASRGREMLLEAGAIEIPFPSRKRVDKELKARRDRLRAEGERLLSEEAKLNDTIRARASSERSRAAERRQVARVLGDLRDAFGPVAAAVFGEREILRLRQGWRRSGADRREIGRNIDVIRRAFRHVTGREPWARWHVPPGLRHVYAGRMGIEFGLDYGRVGADGRWSRTCSHEDIAPGRSGQGGEP